MSRAAETRPRAACRGTSAPVASTSRRPRQELARSALTPLRGNTTPPLVEGLPNNAWRTSHSTLSFGVAPPKVDERGNFRKRDTKGGHLTPSPTNSVRSRFLHLAHRLNLEGVIARLKSKPFDHLLALLLALLWMLVAPARFRTETVPEFGFTYTYTQIADASLATGRYSGTLSGASNRNYDSPKIRDEVQREPLYPAALILLGKLGRPYTDILPFQRLAVAIALYLWGVFAARNFGRYVMAGMFFLETYAPAPGFYVSVIYPYAFQFLLITCAMLAAIQGLRTGSWPWFLASGVAHGLACYERGAYILLPVAVAAGVLVLRPRPRQTRQLGLMIVATALVVSPWLIRSARFGQTGMNGMLGYALGFSYGHLPSAEDTPFIREYDQSVSDRGNDAGTIGFMARVADRENISLPDVDRRVVRLVLKKMIHNPLGVIKVLALNVASLPARLTGVENSRFVASGYDRDPATYTRLYLFRRTPTIPDIIFFALAILALLEGIRQQSPAAIVVALTFVYTCLFICLLVYSDPRYRGAAEPALLVFACAKIQDLIKQRRWPPRLWTPNARTRLQDA
jgi:hypothetical protein